MNPLKQAFKELKIRWQLSLCLGLAAIILVFAAQFISYAGGFALTLGLFTLQYISYEYLRRKTKPSWSKDVLLALVVLALILLPTSFLTGSAHDLLHSKQSPLMTLSSATLLFLLCFYFFTIMSHALFLHIERKEMLAKAIDVIAITSTRYFIRYFAWSFYPALAMVFASFTKGVGYAIVLPLVFYFNFYTYLEINQLSGFKKSSQ